MSEYIRETIRVRTLFQLLNTELQDLGQLAEVAQETLSNALTTAINDPAAHREAQMLDVLTQRLQGLSGFLATLGPIVPRIWQINTSAAVRTLTLGALADRLNGVPPEEVTQEFGDIEMF